MTPDPQATPLSAPDFKEIAYTRDDLTQINEALRKTYLLEKNGRRWTADQQAQHTAALRFMATIAVEMEAREKAEARAEAAESALKSMETERRGLKSFLDIADAELGELKAELAQAKASPHGGMTRSDIYNVVTGILSKHVKGINLEAWPMLRNELTDAISSRLTPPDVSAAKVPDGWKLVPREPTREMLQAFIDNAPMHNLDTIKRLEKQGGSTTLSDAQLAEVWRAGYDAAPGDADEKETK